MTHKGPIHKILWTLLPVSVFALFVAVSFNPDSATANGIGTVVKDEVIGPYHVKVGIDPFPAKTGRTTLSVSIEDTAGEPVLQSGVDAVVLGPEGSVQSDLTLEFGSDPWDPIHHFAAFELVEPGTWTFDIQIDGQLGEADFKMPIEFVTESTIALGDENRLILPMTIFAAVILFAIISGVIFRLVKSRNA